MDAQPTSQRWVWSLVWGQDVVRCFVLVGGPVDGRENMDDTVDRTLSPTWSGASVWGLVGGWCVYVVSGPRVCELAGGGCITWSGVSWIPRVSSLACVRRARWDTRRAFVYPNGKHVLHTPYAFRSDTRADTSIRMSCAARICGAHFVRIQGPGAFFVQLLLLLQLRDLTTSGTHPHIRHYRVLPA